MKVEQNLLKANIAGGGGGGSGVGGKKGARFIEMSAVQIFFL